MVLGNVELLERFLVGWNVQLTDLSLKDLPFQSFPSNFTICPNDLNYTKKISKNKKEIF